ncbi:unnamed protein product [Calypogeia fissa]
MLLTLCVARGRQATDDGEEFLQEIGVLREPHRRCAKSVQRLFSRRLFGIHSTALVSSSELWTGSALGSPWRYVGRRFSVGEGEYLNGKETDGRADGVLELMEFKLPKLMESPS